MDRETLEFARLYWERRETSFIANKFLGVPCFQNPFDAWMMQEILYDTRPEVLIECGSFCGGSALLWASLMELIGIDGTVVAIDIMDTAHELARSNPLWQRRVRWITGSTTAPEVVEEATAIAAGRRTMVLLDSDHHKAHVLDELSAYAGVVSSGCYLVVQDGLVSTLMPEYGEGPAEALEVFLATDDRFEVDVGRERMLFSGATGGHLLRR